MPAGSCGCSPRLFIGLYPFWPPLFSCAIAPKVKAAKPVATAAATLVSTDSFMVFDVDGLVLPSPIDDSSRTAPLSPFRSARELLVRKDGASFNLLNEGFLLPMVRIPARCWTPLNQQRSPISLWSAWWCYSRSGIS